jgi:hypothetical protein
MFTYDPRVLDALATHGLVPRPSTSPQHLRDAVRELYKYEIRRLRGEVLAGRIRRPDYAGHIVELRRRYWLLSVPVDVWAQLPWPREVTPQPR